MSRFIKRTKFDHPSDPYQQPKQIFSPGNSNMDFKPDATLLNGLGP